MARRGGEVHLVHAGRWEGFYTIPSVLEGVEAGKAKTGPMKNIRIVLAEGSHFVSLFGPSIVLALGLIKDCGG